MPTLEVKKPGHREDVKRLLREARDLYAQGRLNEVEDVLRSVIERAPQASLAYHLLGTVYLERKDEERAFKIFSEAAHQFPEDAVLHYDLGFLYAQRGVNALAREELTRALRLQPEGGLAARARLFLQTGTVGRPSGPPIDHPGDRPPGEFVGPRPPDRTLPEQGVVGDSAVIGQPVPSDRAPAQAAVADSAGGVDNRAGGNDAP
jgi:tetratricopeptide (TPR) repeat protein